MNIIFLNSNVLFNIDKDNKLDTMLNINLLKYDSDAKFVLTDKTNQPFYRLKDKLYHNGYPIIPIDIIANNIKAQKGHKINLWLQNNECDNFVIIDSYNDNDSDSDSDISLWYDNVVKIHPKEGFTKKKRKMTLSLLRGKVDN